MVDDMWKCCFTDPPMPTREIICRYKNRLGQLTERGRILFPHKKKKTKAHNPYTKTVLTPNPAIGYRGMSVYKTDSEGKQILER